MPRTAAFAVVVTATAILYASNVRAADAPMKPGYQIQCFEDPISLQQFCFAPAKLTANGRIRSSPLYTGKGPELSLTALAAVADCRKTTIVVRNAKGETPADAPRLEPRVAEALARDMCTAPKPTVDKKLKG